MPVSRVHFFLTCAYLLTAGYCRAQQCGSEPGLPSPSSECCGRDYADVDKITGNVHTTEAQLSTTERSGPRKRGGKATELEQFPWTVLLETTFINGTVTSTFNCGGALISSFYVLTAAHCVTMSYTKPKSVQINLAEYDKRTFPHDCMRGEEGHRCIKNLVMYAESITIHSGFDEEGLLNDLAIIRLQGPVPYTEAIRPICLPSADIDDPQYAKYNLVVAGWGLDGYHNSDVKQSTSLHLVPQETCKQYYRTLTRSHLCAGSLTGRDTCQGDSGGPLMMVSGGKYYVVGIVSGKRADVPCGATIPSLYTNVFHYSDWIRRNTRK